MMPLTPTRPQPQGSEFHPSFFRATDADGGEPMQFEISSQEAHLAKIPHEIFLTNLIGNHILWFVAALGVVKSYWQPLALVPLVSIASLVYTLWRARQSRRRDPWYVMCHWQIAARRSRLLILMFALVTLAALLGWLAYTQLHWMKEAVYAFVGGIGVLPVMVTILVLIILESDALHQASQHRLPKGILTRFPNAGAKVIEEALTHH